MAIMPIFVEFVSTNYPKPGAKHHYIGASIEVVLEFTNGGKQSGSAFFSSHKQISEVDVKALKLDYQTRYNEVRQGWCQCAKLRSS